MTALRQFHLRRKARGCGRRAFFLAPLVFITFASLFFCGGPAEQLRAEEPAPVQTNAPPTRILVEPDALALLTAALQTNYVKDRGELELTFTQPWTAPVVPDAPLTVKFLELPGPGVTPAFIVRFQLCTATKTLGTWQAALQAHVWREVWVAHTDLRRGGLIADANLARERRDVLGVNETLAEFSPGDTSLELSGQVTAGNLLLARHLKPRTVIHRGQTAQALLQDGAMSIMMKVEALEDGAPGQIIHARNPATQRNLSGKVMDEKTILISI